MPPPTRFLAVVLLIASAASARSQEIPRFTAGVAPVLVDALVLDANGEPVGDLETVDFEVYEDGVRQTIATFSVTDWTSYVSARESEGVGSDQRPNAFPRRFVLMLNRQGAQFGWLVRAKRALSSFVVESLADGDEVMVVDVGPSLRIHQPFEDRKERTLESIRELSQMRFDYPMGRNRASGQLYRDLEALAAELELLPGRKVLVLLSNELSTFTLPGSTSSDEGMTLVRAVDALNQANVSVYTIDLRGPESTLSVTGGLSPLALETGGRYFRNSIRFDQPLRRIGQENARYYLLSYVSTNAERDGSYRRIEVRLAGPERDGVEVIARRGYFARDSAATSDAEASTELEASVEEPLPDPPPVAVEMMSYLLPTPYGSALVPLSVALPAELLDESPRRLEVRILHDGETLHQFDENVSLSHYYIVENVDLEPGSYEMSVTLSDDDGALYRASTPIDVPEGFGERFGLSSIVPVLGPEAAGRSGAELPILPTTTLESGRDAYLLFQVFAGRERPSREAHLRYTIKDEHDMEVGAGGKDGPMALRDAEATPVVLRVPMNHLGPGTYRVDVRVEDRSRGRGAGSEIELRIR